MITNIHSEVKCPYCGHKNSIKQAPEEYKHILTMYCNIDNGGCDGLFVVILPSTIVVTAEARKVEGETGYHIKE